jgi:hypothetical protein
MNSISNAVQSVASGKFAKVVQAAYDDFSKEVPHYLQFRKPGLLEMIQGLLGMADAFHGKEPRPTKFMC